MENPRISRRWLENAGKWWEDHASPIENWIWFRFNYHLEGSIHPVEHWDSDLATPRSASIWSRSILAELQKKNNRRHAVPSIFPPKYLPRSHGFVLDLFISRAFFRDLHICAYIYYNICLSLYMYIYILNSAHENNLKQITAPTSCWKMGISLQRFFFNVMGVNHCHLWRWWSPWFWDWIRLDFLFFIPLKMTGFYENPMANFLVFGTLWLTYSKTPL
jgi:hypothetical protein